MGFVYRYTDLIDGVIKYIGIVYSDRSLSFRLKEHEKCDDWCKDGCYKIEYIQFNNRSTLEAVEAHLISLYGTDKFFNKAKTGWGICEFIPDLENKWIKYNGGLEAGNFELKTKKRRKLHNNNFIKISLSYYESVKNQIPDVYNRVIPLYVNGEIICIKEEDNQELFRYLSSNFMR